MPEEALQVEPRLKPMIYHRFLVACCDTGQLPTNMPEKGVYLFSDGRKHLYIGRSNGLRKRYYRNFHSRSGATFAFLMARKETGRLKPAYRKGEDSREGLMKDKAFKDAFAYDEAVAALRLRIAASHVAHGSTSPAKSVSS